MKIITTFILTFLSVLLLTCPSSHASTADGVTPANEGVCDSLQADGVTKGLYGLCVAYCEAQDAAEIVDIDEIDQLNPPSKSILRNYERRMKEGDPQMPCVNYVSECPVFNADELAKINTTAGDMYENDHSYAQVYPFASSLVLRESVREVLYLNSYLPLWLIGRSTPIVSALTAEREDNTLVGQYFDRELGINRVQELTAEEYNGCELAIKTNIIDSQQTGFCGDGIRTAGPESCDDGNNNDGDGCSAVCVIEQ